MSSLPVAARLAAIADERGDAPAVVGGDGAGSRGDAGGGEQVLSWRVLAAETARLAARLRTHTDGAGGPVVVAVEAGNTPDAVVRLLGALAADLPVLPLDPRAPRTERDRLLSFVGREYGPVCVLSGDDIGWSAAGRGAASAATAPAAPRRAVGYLLATGGSSGLPKVVAAPGPVRYDPARVPSPLLRKAGWRTGQRQLVAGPLHHTAAFTHCLAGVLDANTVVLLPTFAPDHLLDLVRGHAVEWLQLTPAHLRSVVQLADPKPADLASVRAVLHTAAACDIATKRAWLELVGPERIFETYGSTEEIGVTLARGDEWLARPGTVGRGFLTQIRILDAAGASLPAGEIGTIYLRSGRMAARAAYLGGLRMPTTPDGFASVGDRGWLDEDGYLFIAPRRLDLINVGGENVYPAEVEAAILEHPEVLDAVAVAAPDPVLGAVVHARVVRAGSGRLTSAELIRHCAGRLAPYKVPRRVTFVASVPRSSAGKLERWRMRDREGG